MFIGIVFVEFDWMYVVGCSRVVVWWWIRLESIIRASIYIYSTCITHQHSTSINQHI